MQELEEAGGADDGTTDRLVERCKAHFKAVSPADTQASREAQLAQLKQHMPEGTNVSNSMVDALSGMLLVETLALQSGSKENGYVHVNMYVDDRGALKGLQHNPRATEIARLAGVSTDIRGDAFLGRTRDDGSEFKRLSFSFSECSSSAQWFEQARLSNTRRQQQSSSLSEFASNSNTKMINMGNASSAVTSDESEPVQDSSGTFTWSQDDEEVFLEIVCPPNTKSKDIECSFNTQHLRIKRPSAETCNENETVVDTALSRRIHPDECHWSLSDDKGQKKLTVTLTKAGAGHWTSVQQE